MLYIRELRLGIYFIISLQKFGTLKIFLWLRDHITSVSIILLNIQMHSKYLARATKARQIALENRQKDFWLKCYKSFKSSGPQISSRLGEHDSADP
jgi:hypothetical protein